MLGRVQLVSLDMGYGHLRAAWPLSKALGTPVLAADELPLATAMETATWAALRKGHVWLSNPPGLERFVRQANALMDAVTVIPPLYSQKDQSKPDLAARLLAAAIERGFGSTLVDYFRQRGDALLTTFYAPAIIADAAGLEHIYVVVTDADVARIWVPAVPEQSRIHYFAASNRVVRRLRAYGVAPERITHTGFPLSGCRHDQDLTELRRVVARRIARLDPMGTFRSLYSGLLEQVLGTVPSDDGQPIKLLFAVGGAGGQVELGESVLRRLVPSIRAGRLEIQLVAGTRSAVAERFEQVICGLGLTGSDQQRVRILYAPNITEYFERFDEAVTESDLLWTKPSELSFYAGLGIPIVIAPPVGSHERYNRRWLREMGAGLKQRNLDQLPGWFDDWLSDGALAAAAWNAFTRAPREGTSRIVAELRERLAPVAAREAAVRVASGE